MSKEFQLISDVSPGSSGWTVKVVVAEKFSPRIAQKSPTKYQNFLLMDTELSCKLCIPTDEKDFTEIRNIQGVKTVKQFFWIKGKASVTVLNQNYWYMSCNNCNKISSENYGDIYHCVFCKCLEAQAIPR
ncbi:replication protein A 70 kDa DNA-binding subunit B-like [Forsythia ovata]|uniref:Replication protein A 70 kDa DNA-binding subunit B-like n=1 Tax=Forsythia ovata TaxID=205694 RepID=A0ABD1NYY6_9LAMI